MNFLTLFKIKKNHNYNRLITRKILEIDMKFCYKNISEIRNVSFICQTSKNKKKYILAT